MKRIIAILLTIFGWATITAQHLSLDTCKAMALRNNAAVKNAVLDEKAAQEVKMQARTKYFPQISATGIGYVPAKPLIEYGIDDIGSAAARQQLHNLYYEYGAAMGLSDKISLCDGGLGRPCSRSSWADRLWAATRWLTWGLPPRTTKAS